MIALQRTDQFVGRTMNWLYDHLRVLPRYRPLVLCDTLANRREFPELEARTIDDDRLGLLTVTGVQVDPDLRHAVVWLSSLSSTGEEVLAKHRVRLQGAIARQMRLKRTPELRFRADPAIETAQRVEDILRGLEEDRD